MLECKNTCTLCRFFSLWVLNICEIYFRVCGFVSRPDDASFPRQLEQLVIHSEAWSDGRDVSRKTIENGATNGLTRKNIINTIIIIIINGQEFIIIRTGVYYIERK